MMDITSKYMLALKEAEEYARKKMSEGYYVAISEDQYGWEVCWITTFIGDCCEDSTRFDVDEDEDD